MFDSHAHYDDARFDGDREDLLCRLFGECGVTGIVNAGSDIPSSLASIDLAHRFDGVYAAVGIHPQSVDDAPDGWLDTISRLAADKKVVAIGEIGLDYHYDTPSRDRQLLFFERQLELARKCGLPAVVHDRDAHSDCVSLALRSGAKGVFHSFSGSPETAEQLVRAGWYISISGVVTFKNAARAPEVVRAVPQDRLLVETDCPYLAPVPCRGQRNDSSLMRSTLERIAELRGVDFACAEEFTAANARALFGIRP